MDIEIKSKNLSQIEIGKLLAKYSVKGDRIIRYHIDFWHKELGLHKELGAPELYLLQDKVDALMLAWDKRLAEHQRNLTMESGRELAERLTAQARAKMDALANILSTALERRGQFDWNSLKDFSKFEAVEAALLARKPRPPAKAPQYIEPEISIWAALFGQRRKKQQQAQHFFMQQLGEWEQVDADYKIKADTWQKEIDDKRSLFEAEKATKNARAEEFMAGVQSGDSQAVIEHITLVLERSDYSEIFYPSFIVDYKAEDKLAMIKYELPAPDGMPKLKSARFINASQEIKETYFSERDQKATFDSACYQICLRTIHEVFNADEFGNVENILFNGFVTSIDRSTGHYVTSCIMSILANRPDFAAINLRMVDPKICFKNLKGVSASTLSVLAPIPPIMEMDREDSRFIDARNIVDQLNEGTNLAAMDWQDFEHLVRELFEKEFAARGGEVKVTQSSGDGGVDAVAFDPDPITGGKIVIQAKRYTRTVGVSAVRDLFGTMQHESASKGILVTTTDYGPDAHKFASGKPITLLTGQNLLHLLEKHGTKAKIDLQAARDEMHFQNRR
ncbi:restriction endonuclease [Methylocella sp. CPCC 101449]|uniref:restriction endonuclease n=1 Tax=Methylocella sp. CPCC 101449 TaxID=2987531 RepID=UPI0028917E88|nr:restriction endonuclease [Methylocella sp. CPCC 101449]MDT2019199.1 restriction endonuclease [Methylocella sp. CPCC 101449]